MIYDYYVGVVFEYLTCTSLGLGTCAIAAYDQKACDELLRVDGEEEFAIYLAPVGRIAGST